MEIYPFEIECISLKDDATVPIPVDSLEKAKGTQEHADRACHQQASVNYHHAGMVGDGPAIQEVYDESKMWGAVSSRY